MCGITAYFGNEAVGGYLLNSLKRLEYRGYDSAGIATLSDGEISVRKDVGEIDEIDEKLNLDEMDGNAAIGHTRWCTHGSVTKENAHPHTSCDGRFAIVHNGIIENWEEIKGELEGHEFTSETDSEVIAHYVEEKCQERGVEDALRKFFERAEGNFAVVLLDSVEKNMYAFKRGSPLAIGVGNGEVFLGSDIYAFSTRTDEALFLEDDEYAVINGGDYTIKTSSGESLTRTPEKFDWNQEESKKGGFEHFMKKEIEEIPQVLKRLEGSLKSSQSGEMEKLVKSIEEHEKVLFTASGTSYHASLLGVYFLHEAGVDAQTLIASEFQNFERVDEDTLVIAISQSGETRDVLDAVEFSKKRGGDVASLINVPHSTLARESDITLRIMAGQELCVAATKTFINHVYLLLRLAGELGREDDLSALAESIGEVIETNEPKIMDLAKELEDSDDIYVIGRGETYPVAREIALKLKEISYVHAEGMMGGELKHGTLALVEEGTPVISLIPERNTEIISNVKEVESRGARSIRVSPWTGPFEFPNSNSKFGFYATVIGFLLAYWMARERDLPIDHPRNLAKSVSVR